MTPIAITPPSRTLGGVDDYLEHDPNLLFRGELPAGLAADVANGLLGRVFLGHGFFLLSESRTRS